MLSSMSANVCSQFQSSSMISAKSSSQPGRRGAENLPDAILVPRIGHEQHGGEIVSGLFDRVARGGLRIDALDLIHQEVAGLMIGHEADIALDERLVGRLGMGGGARQGGSQRETGGEHFPVMARHFQPRPSGGKRPLNRVRGNVAAAAGGQCAAFDGPPPKIVGRAPLGPLCAARAQRLS
jgi:hypothetical protein